MAFKKLVLLLMAIPLTGYAQNYQIMHDSFPTCTGIISEGNYSIAGEIGTVEGGIMTDGSYQIFSGLLLYGTHFSTDVVEDTLPVIFTKLNQNYPNPFNPETIIQYSLRDNVERMELKIYNIRGQLVRTLVDNSPYLKGEFQIVWDGKNDFGRPVTSGVYFYRMTTPSFDQVNKMLLLK